MKEKINELFSYAKSLYYESTGDIIEPRNFYELKEYLEGQKWIVQITSDFYYDGVHFNWQVLIWDYDNYNYISKYSTIMYGGDKGYSTSYSAMIYGTLRALELFSLYKTIDNSFNKEIGEKKNSNLLSIVDKYDYIVYENAYKNISPRLEINNKPSEEIESFVVDQEWWKYERKTAKEYINYIKQRIKEIMKWKTLDVGA